MSCFEYSTRWMEIREGLLSDDPAKVARAIELLEARDRELEQWSCRSGLPKSWCANDSNSIVDGASFAVTTPTLTDIAATGMVALANVIITNPDPVNPVNLTCSGHFQLDGVDLDGNLAEYQTVLAPSGQTTRGVSCLVGSVVSTAGYIIYNNSGADISVQLSITVTETDSQSGTCCNVAGGGG